ncbi:hypothetical protein WN944_006841 [Citrus x changshan-huyou]|uniref:Uncharacterized protein n=1 Tax=Citrus x changshan-huyou TaxID=2935761 RepID=A0AAP0MJV9_9ROSI
MWDPPVRVIGGKGSLTCMGSRLRGVTELDFNVMREKNDDLDLLVIVRVLAVTGRNGIVREETFGSRLNRQRAVTKRDSDGREHGYTGCCRLSAASLSLHFLEAAVAVAFGPLVYSLAGWLANAFLNFNPTVFVH